MGRDKDFVLRSAHGSVIFDIFHKIWSIRGSYACRSPGGSVGFSAPPLEDGGVEDFGNSGGFGCRLSGGANGRKQS
ncbi:hypothetical protein EJD97_018281 [Solanum chilense]|uniref:Uncharacterized protein n=1 Tax=Solanum chilense TaxID=4083 RepID=A0A6N2B4Z7_SOLCI|nr:hypothetical protein EJD97_018281 [Solanum chilense]